MGRNRKLTAELDRKGSFEKDPDRGRARALEPEPEGGLGAPPPDFLLSHRLELRRAWDDLVAATASVKLTSADRLHFEATARLMYRTRQSTAKTGDFTALTQALGKLGLTPVDRSRVPGHGKITEDEESDAWDDYASGGSELRVQ